MLDEIAEVEDNPDEDYITKVSNVVCMYNKIICSIKYPGLCVCVCACACACACAL